MSSIANWFTNRLFRYVHGNHLVYNTCWEDPRLDREVMALGPTDEVVLITSAGCNALDYALDGPQRIHAVDLNHRQNALLELKLSGIRSGLRRSNPGAAWWQNPSNERLALLPVGLGRMLPRPRSSSYLWEFLHRRSPRMTPLTAALRKVRGPDPSYPLLVMVHQAWFALANQLSIAWIGTPARTRPIGGES